MPKRVKSLRRDDESTPLAKIRNRYLSLQALADDLARFPDFKDISPSTILRWLNIEAGRVKMKALPPRACRAIELLTSAPPSRPLRVAFPISPQSLPIILLTHLTGAEKLAPPIPPLSINATRVETGIMALDALNQDDGVDVAVCYRYIRSEEKRQQPDYGARCARLSSFCCQIVHGFGIYPSKYPPIVTRRMLSTTRFGYPRQSGIRIFLEDNIHFEPFGNYVPQVFEDPSHAVDLLLNETIQYALGSQPTLRAIEMEMRKRHPEKSLVAFPDSLLPNASFDLFFNKESKNPSAILTLLDCLRKIIPQMESVLRQLEKSESKALAERLGYDQLDDLVAALKPPQKSNRAPIYDFTLDTNINLDALLTLWRKTLSV